MKRIRLRITTKLLMALLSLTTVSLVAFTWFALDSMTGIGDSALKDSAALGEQAVNDSVESLMKQAEDNIGRMAGDQAVISDSFFLRASAQIDLLASYASGLWQEPPPQVLHRSWSLSEQPPNVKDASVWQAAPGVDVASNWKRIELMANMDDLFIPAFASNRNISWVYFGTVEGLFRVYPWRPLPAEYDCRVRPWYTRAIESGKTGWTEAYVDPSSQDLKVACSKPVLGPDGKLVGVVSLDISLNEIAQSISKTRVGDNGYAFLLDQHACVIFRPDMNSKDTRWDESYKTDDLSESTNWQLRSVALRMTLGESGVNRLDMDGGEKYLAFAPIPSTGWSVGLVLPRSEVIAPAVSTRESIEKASADTGASISSQIDGSRNTFVGIFVFLMAAVAGVAWYLARRITRPILALDSGAKMVGAGNLDYQLDIKTGDEIETLATTFNKMTADLKAHIAQLQETTAARERIESELRVATEIQTSMLPRIFPPFPDRKEFEIFAAMKPAREVGGDFYDFFFVTPNKLCFTIGDVSGKGIPAALFMAISRTLIKTEGMRDIPPDQILSRVNAIMYPDNDASMFLTCFCGIFDTDSGEILYSNGGHLPPLLYAGGDTFNFVKVPTGLVVGAMPDVRFECRSIILKPGDVFFLYTDGVTEATNPRNELFSESRLQQAASRFRDKGIKDFCADIGAEVDKFAQGSPQADDITVLALRFKGPISKSPEGCSK